MILEQSSSNAINEIRVVYFSTYANPLYFTSDLRQIRYTTHPTYKHVVLQLLNGLVPPALDPLACPSRGAGVGSKGYSWSKFGLLKEL